MKKVILNVVAAVLMVFGLASVASISPAHAATCANGKYVPDIKQCEEWNNSEIAKQDNLMGTLQTVVNVIVGVIGFVAVIMMIMGGISFVTSQGDASKVAKARNTILYGVVGLVVALLAFAIVNFVLSSVFSSSSTTGGGSGGGSGDSGGAANP